MKEHQQINWCVLVLSYLFVLFVSPSSSTFPWLVVAWYGAAPHRVGGGRVLRAVGAPGGELGGAQPPAQLHGACRAKAHGPHTHHGARTYLLLSAYMRVHACSFPGRGTYNIYIIDRCTPWTRTCPSCSRTTRSMTSLLRSPRRAFFFFFFLSLFF